MTNGRYGTQWRVTPARIAEEHALHVAQIEREAADAAVKAAVARIAAQRGIGRDMK